MVKPKPVVVAQFPWAAVKQTSVDLGSGPLPSFDVWQWNIHKMKWVRLSNTACGFSDLQGASAVAKEISDETQTALDNNRLPPPPL